MGGFIIYSSQTGTGETVGQENGKVRKVFDSKFEKIPLPAVAVTNKHDSDMDAVSHIKQELDAKLHTTLNVGWIQQCLLFLESKSLGRLPALPQLVKQVEDQLLVSNLEHSSLGILPVDIATRHGQTLRGQYFVQVQDLINISEPSERRFLHSAHRTLKLGLFDGKTCISALELIHIPQLSLDLSAGFKMIIKDPKIAHGMLILSKEGVNVLGGQVPSLVTRTEALKAATQRSTLPQEWSDSLGQLQDLGTDTRLDGEAQEANQDNSSPSRPLPPAILAPLPSTALHQVGSINSQLDNRAGATSSPYRPTFSNPKTAAPPVALGFSSGANKSMPSVTTTKLTINAPTHPQSSSFIKMAPTAPTPAISSNSTLPMDDILDGIDDEAMFNDIEVQARTKKETKIKQPPIPPIEIPLPPEPFKNGTYAHENGTEYENDRTETIDDYIDRIESSQASRDANRQNSMMVDNMSEHDIEDMFEEREYELASQELIEPPESPNYMPLASPRLEDDEDGDEEFTIETPSKKPKLEEETDVGLDLWHTDRFSGENGSDDDLIELSQMEFATQVQRSKEITLIADLFLQDKNQKCRIRAECQEVSFPQVVGNTISWTVTIEDSSANVEMPVNSNFTLQLFGTPTVQEFLTFSTGPDFSAAQISDLAKSLLSTELFLKWSTPLDSWEIVGSADS